MRFSLLVALVATVSTTAAAAATTSTRRTSTTKTSSAATHTSSATLNYWWSYHAENNTESYDPAFEICGSSCADCWDGARSCFAQEFSNICYEPGRGETCCKDKYGTSCYKDFYCAYTDDDIAFCCANGEDVNVCGKTFNETLTRSDRVQPTATTVTAIFTPSMTASDQSVAARPERTAPPSIPGGTSAKNNSEEDIAVKKDISTAAKVGIAIGSFVGAAILVTLIVMFVLYKRNKGRYDKLGDAKHTEPFHTEPPTRPHSVAPSAFEPMRNEYADNRQSWASSPPPTFGTSPAPYRGAAYSDHPPAPATDISHLPPPGISEAPATPSHHS